MQFPVLDFGLVHSGSEPFKCETVFIPGKSQNEGLVPRLRGVLHEGCSHISQERTVPH